MTSTNKAKEDFICSSSFTKITKDGYEKTQSDAAPPAPFAVRFPCKYAGSNFSGNFVSQDLQPKTSKQYFWAL